MDSVSSCERSLAGMPANTYYTEKPSASFIAPLCRHLSFIFYYSSLHSLTHFCPFDSLLWLPGSYSLICRCCVSSAWDPFDLQAGRNLINANALVLSTCYTCQHVQRHINLWRRTCLPLEKFSIFHYDSTLSDWAQKNDSFLYSRL